MMFRRGRGAFFIADGFLSAIVFLDTRNDPSTLEGCISHLETKPYTCERELYIYIDIDMISTSYNGITYTLT